MSNAQLWVEKYRPKTLDDMVLDKSIKHLIKTCIEQKTLFNLLFAGKQGIGKSSLADVIINELKCDNNSLYINCGYERGIDDIKYRLKDFCDSPGIEDGIKLVILDEVDCLTHVALNSLKSLLEENLDDTRFVLTCNHLNKIIEPIQSRCTPIKLTYSVEDVIMKVITILKEEKIVFEKEVLVQFINVIVKKQFPDIRSIINILQHWCNTGTMVNNGNCESTEIEQFIDQLIALQDCKKIREMYIANEDKFSNDYELLGGYLFHKVTPVSHKLLVADFLKNAPNVLDKEIQFYALILNLFKN